MRNTFIFFLAAMILPGYSMAGNPCSIEGERIERSYGVIPYINGEISYDSQRERRNFEFSYVWRVVQNTSGYAINIKWGSAENDKEYISNIVVKNDNEEPRCRIKSSSRLHDKDDRIIKYKRKGNSSWEEERPETVFEEASLSDYIYQYIERIGRVIAPEAKAQSNDDYIKLRMMYQSGGVPGAVEEYYSPEHGLNVDGLLSDGEALNEYFNMGFDVVQRYSILVSDFPIDEEAASPFFQEGDIDSDKLTPIYIYAGASVRRISDGVFTTEYAFYSEVLEDGLAEEFEPDAFSKVRMSIAPSAENDIGNYFSAAFEENSEEFRILEFPGKGRQAVVKVEGGSSFNIDNSGIMFVRTSDYRVPIMNFSILVPTEG